METFEINGVTVMFLDIEPATEAEARDYLYFATERWDVPLKKVTVKRDGGWADVRAFYRLEPFERIRRITGYLVGTTDRWNSAKLSELKDRVRHDS